MKESWKWSGRYPNLSTLSHLPNSNIKFRRQRLLISYTWSELYCDELWRVPHSIQASITEELWGYRKYSLHGNSASKVLEKVQRYFLPIYSILIKCGHCTGLVRASKERCGRRFLKWSQNVFKTPLFLQKNKYWIEKRKLGWRGHTFR